MTCQTMTLRPYQRVRVDAALDHLTAGRSCVVVGGTGVGKTVIACAVIRAIGVPTVVVVPRVALREQWERELARWGATARVVTIQSVRGPTPDEPDRECPALDPAELVVVDEAHNYQTPRRASLLRGRLLLGLTATPRRLDGRGLRALFPHQAGPPYTIADGLRDGHLVDCIPHRVHCRDDTGAVVPLVDDPGVNEQILGHWRRLAPGRLTIAFLPSIEWADSLAAAAGDDAVALHSRSETTVESWLSSRAPLACSVDQFFEGFDCPAVSCIIFVRATKSDRLKVQGIGRGLRPAPGKTDLILIDVSGTANDIDWRGLYELEDDAPDLPPTLTRGPVSPAPAPEADIPTLWDVITWTEQRRSWAERVAAQRRREWVDIDTPSGSGVALGFTFQRRPTLLVLRPASDPTLLAAEEWAWAPDGEPVREVLTPGHPEPAVFRAAEARLDGHGFLVLTNPGEIKRLAKRWLADTAEPSPRMRHALRMAGVQCPPTHGQAVRQMRRMHAQARREGTTGW